MGFGTWPWILTFTMRFNDMEQPETDEQCDRCETYFTILIKDFEQIMKDGDPILCSECETKALDEQAEAERPPKRCFEYKICQVEKIVISDLGIDGWELVSVDNGQAYFKKEFYEES